MSYRNFTDGDDGPIAHARNEFDYASSIGARCGLVVGQQYADVQPAYITFHGFTRSEFQLAARTPSPTPSRATGSSAACQWTTSTRT
jgi:hypothetical protein